MLLVTKVHQFMYNALMNLYHLSMQDLSGKTLYPRVPAENSRMGGEDFRTKRICFASRIAWCLKALEADIDTEFYVHVPVAVPMKIVKPTEKQVPDVKSTHEVWVKEPVTLQKLGKVKVLNEGFWTGKVEWKWIED